MNASLRTLLATDLPDAFVSELINVANWIYRDTHEAIALDSNYDAPEKEYLLPHTRRAIMESKMRELANKHNVQVTIEENSAKNTKYSLIRCGRFALTISKAPGESQLPSKCNFRKQYAEINQHIKQLSLFPLPSNPQDSSIYGIIIHGHDLNDQSKLAFLRIGFPEHEKRGWVEDPIDLLEIMELQALNAQARIQSEHAEQADDNRKTTSQKTLSYQS